MDNQTLFTDACLSVGRKEMGSLVETSG